MTDLTISRIIYELEKHTGLKFIINNRYNCYFYSFDTYNIVSSLIYDSELDIDRANSFIRIIKDRHPELFL